MIREALFVAVALIVNTIMFTWIRDLEKCECAESWKRDALKYSIPVTVALAVVTALVRSPEWRLYLYMVYDIASSFVLLTILSYVVDLRRETCDCSKGWRETFAFVWPLAVASVWLLNVLLVLAIMIISAMQARQSIPMKVYIVE